MEHHSRIIKDTVGRFKLQSIERIIHRSITRMSVPNHDLIAFSPRLELFFTNNLLLIDSESFFGLRLLAYTLISLVVHPPNVWATHFF